MNIEMLKNLGAILSIILSLWAVYKVIIEIQEPRKALEKKVETLDTWHREDHKRIKEIEEHEKLVLKSLYYLVEHEITGNGLADFNTIKSEIERTIF